jgi:asparagine synthase (glutamine-hydrolysing)
MCGILATFSSSTFSQNDANKALLIMSNRGPDNKGEWRDEGVYMGHLRLSILDLDNRSSQPMHSLCERFVIIFNGEIYNYLEIRNDLIAKGIKFRTFSDTEVILELFKLEKEAMLNKLHGMFAFVIWDKQTKTAFAARDPYGIKPLYYSNFKDGLIISSQLKSISAIEIINKEFDYDSEAKFWILGSIPEPNTFYKNIKLLESGNYIWIHNNKIIEQVCWKNIGEIWQNAANLYISIPKHKVQSIVKKAINESISRHIVSDVPIGVFLSGGIDSGTLVGLLSDAKVKDITGITIAYKEFENTKQDEVPVAKEIANFYGIKHHIRYITKAEFFSDLPKILISMDQPSIDGINTWFASKAASELGIKVVLSGVGGDELFMGYNTFKQLPPIVKFFNLFNNIFLFRKFFILFFKTYSKISKNSRWNDANLFLSNISHAWLLKRSSNSINDLPILMNQNFKKINFNSDKLINSITGKRSNNPHLELAQLESMSYLRNQLLRDSDWASMAHSVELRTPFVDFTLLDNLKDVLIFFKDFRNKVLLSNSTSKPLPKSIANRKKTGFAIPVKEWILHNPEYSGNWQKTIYNKYIKTIY